MGQRPLGMLGSLAALLVLLTAGRVEAQVRLDGSLEYLSLREDTSPLEVQEQGVLLALGLRFLQSKERGLRWGYFGRLYGGGASYEGAYLDDPTVPATGSSRHVGITQEGQVRYRILPADEAVGGLVLDVWRRTLGRDQVEDFRVVWIRIGAEHSTSGSDRWTIGGGLKVPIGVQENAHFTDLGFDQNPMLKPGRRVSGFVRVAYRLQDRWTLAGQWDGFAFDRSNVVVLTRGRNMSFSSQPAFERHTVGLKLEYEITRNGR